MPLSHAGGWLLFTTCVCARGIFKIIGSVHLFVCLSGKKITKNHKITRSRDLGIHHTDVKLSKYISNISTDLPHFASYRCWPRALQSFFCPPFVCYFNMHAQLSHCILYSLDQTPWLLFILSPKFVQCLFESGD